MAAQKPALDMPEHDTAKRFLWHPTATFAALVWLLAFVAISNVSKPSAFLYFQF